MSCQHYRNVAGGLIFGYIGETGHSGPHKKALSISSDGGFLFSAMELETAVRLKTNLVHMI
jgi:hypothetical protein